MRFVGAFFFSLLVAGCSEESSSPRHDAGEGGVYDGGTKGHFCDLPGSVRFTEDGALTVPGGKNTTDLSFLHLPVGFCAHAFGNVGNPRQLRFAPGGELFVASPTKTTTGGGGAGKAGIVILPDDDADGEADRVITFLDGIAATQGILFAKTGHFYYQNDQQILRMPYEKGDRKPSGASEAVTLIDDYYAPIHWPKTLDESDDGTIFVANGGDEADKCEEPMPMRGGIHKLDGSPKGSKAIVKGFRNPIAVRCSRGKNLCFAVELAKDFAFTEGREKLVPIREGDDWGFPCCASRNLPYDHLKPAPDCSKTTVEDASFYIGDTPFSFDFEPGDWPEAWKNRIYVPLHGAAGSWIGARVVAIELDPETGLPVKSTDLPGQKPGGMKDFATGWDDHSLTHGRPAAVTFAPDGRMFLANDNNGDIVWIAPVDLKN